METISITSTSVQLDVGRLLHGQGCLTCWHLLISCERGSDRVRTHHPRLMSFTDMRFLKAHFRDQGAWLECELRGHVANLSNFPFRHTTCKRYAVDAKGTKQ